MFINSYNAFWVNPPSVPSLKFLPYFPTTFVSKFIMLFLSFFLILMCPLNILSGLQGWSTGCQVRLMYELRLAEPFHLPDLFLINHNFSETNPSEGYTNKRISIIWRLFRQRNYAIMKMKPCKCPYKQDTCSQFE